MTQKALSGLRVPALPSARGESVPFAERPPGPPHKARIMRAYHVTFALEAVRGSAGQCGPA